MRCLRKIKMGCRFLQSSPLSLVVCSGVDLSGRDIRVPQIIFNKNGINICLYHVHGFCVAENMRRDFGWQSCIGFPCHICILLTPSSGSAKSRRKRRIQPSSVFRLNPRAWRSAIYCSNSIFEVIPIPSVSHKTMHTYVGPGGLLLYILRSFLGCCAQECWRSS